MQATNQIRLTVIGYNVRGGTSGGDQQPDGEALFYQLGKSGLSSEGPRG